MSRKQRRGSRPTVTVLVEQRHTAAGREFTFAPANPNDPPSAHPMRAVLTSRAFSWGPDTPAANDPVARPEPANDADFAVFLAGLHGVYHRSRDR